MIEVSYDRLHNLIAKGETARNYAWAHYEDLASRKASNILYGPISYFLGAASPSCLTPSRERKLTRKTRREKYAKYEFDQNGKLIRISYVNNKHEKDHCVYHLFVLDNVIYGCCFADGEKRFYDERVEAVQFLEGKPAYYSHTSKIRIYCEFYEYPSNGKRISYSYQYSPACELTSYRLQPNWDSPMGSPDSPVSVNYYESDPIDLDFSKYFIENP